MADPQYVLAQRVRHALAAAFGPEHADDDPVIRPSQFADYQANVALPLGKRLGRPPREVAAELARHLDVADLCTEPEVSGPGFINLTLRDEWLATQASEQLADTGVGLDESDVSGQEAAPRGPAAKVVVDYSAPNVAKEMHVGHLRTTVVGDALVRVLERLGHTVIRANHLGDWGTPFGMLIEHTLDVGDAAARDALSGGEINAFYQAARRKFDSDPAFAERSRRRVVALQAGDGETLRLWQVLVDDSKQYYNTIYDRLGVTLSDTDLAPESFYNPMLADVCDELQKSGVAVISDGALCAFPPGFTNRDGQPLPMILRKSDGGYGYDSTDLAAIRYRIRDLKADRLIYVVAAEQSLHFQMLFAVARQAGWLTDEVSAEHAVIGLVTGADGKRLRTRSGATVKLITLIDEAVERAEQVIGERYDDPAERQRIATAVGIGALKYADLSVARDSGYALDFDRMLALTGNTGPYLQYATARIRSIFRKAGLDPDEAMGPIQIGEEAERALALKLLGFATVVLQVAETTEPHRLCGYLFELASTFTTFYENCPVLAADSDAARDSRLALSALTLRVLLTGLGLLGVPVPERM
ncbi:MAG TPA: arginine--tRNA ligase [Streptosporangiaceae bacterium]|jgi:arginyl-tRNA synthetase|nr:arginine--tRNA ligase [Streptosporangiaceae bacterium]